MHEEEARKLARLRVVAASVRTEVERPTIEVGYGCDDCDGRWLRVTAKRVLPATLCPFCGGRARILRASTWTNP